MGKSLWFECSSGFLWNDAGVYTVAQRRGPLATSVGFTSGLEDSFFRS